MKQKRRMKGKNCLLVIQVGVKENMILTPETPGAALNTGLGPAPEELGIKEACLVLGTGKALGKERESQVQATSRIVRKISMVLISTKGLGVNKLVILIQGTVAQDQTQQISQVLMENKGMCATERISLPVLTNTGLTQMNL